MIGITIILIHYFIKRVLFLDISLQINNNQIKQMTLTTINTNNMHIICVSQIRLHILIDVLRTRTFKVHCDWHMEHKFINSVATIFYKIIFKQAFFFLVILILIKNRMISRMSWMSIFYTFLTIEHLSLSIKLVNYICQITFIKQCFPIKSMHIWSAFAILREILIVDLEQIHLPLLNKLVDIRNRYSCKRQLITLLFYFTIESTEVFICRSFREIKSKLTPIFMLINRLLKVIYQIMAILNTEILSLFVSTIVIFLNKFLTWLKILHSGFSKKHLWKHLISTWQQLINHLLIALPI